MLTWIDGTLYPDTGVPDELLLPGRPGGFSRPSLLGLGF
jgi:hypothetical protein